MTRFGTDDTVAKEASQPREHTPFARIKGRHLVLWLVASFVITILVHILAPVPHHGDRRDNLLPDAVDALAFSTTLFAGAWLLARAAGLSFRGTYGDLPSARVMARLCALAFPLLGLAFVTTYLVYAPLSLVFPDGVQAWLFEDAFVFYSASHPYPLAGNALILLAGVVAAPIAEEWFFRGLLWRRWAHRSGAVQATLASSALFGLLHVDPIGAFVFGLVMCAVYARYGTLWAPTIVHGAGNGLVWALSVLDAHGVLSTELDSVAQLRAAWWLPIAGVVLAAPWLFRWRARYGPMSGWRVAER